MPRKPSILRNPDAVKNAASNAHSIKDALHILGLRAAGGNYKAFQKACIDFNVTVPISPFAGRPPLGRGGRRLSNNEIFVENSPYSNRTSIKLRMIKNGTPEICGICGMLPTWNQKPLVLQLDHINGVHNDNRIENLRLVCPNCHSQTDTFCGRSSLKSIVEKEQCQFCGFLNVCIAKRCGGCKRFLYPRQGKSAIDWPSDSELVGLAVATPLSRLATILGVSDTAIRKRLISRKLIEFPIKRGS